MIIFESAIGIPWLIFLVYWLTAALSAKPTIRGRRQWRGAGIRLAIAIIAVLLLHSQYAHSSIHQSTASNLPVGAAGVLLTAAGIALAIWARRHLGRNWGMPMSLKQDPELVTTGPYRTIRHPIYSGILLAIVGTGLVTPTLLWLIPLVLLTAFFISSAITEENVMIQQFPRDYPAYKARTKMLIPFIL